MRDYDLRLSKYGISTSRYRELCGFCRQYDEKRHKLEELRGLKSRDATRQGRGIGLPGDPTGDAAVKSARLAADVRLIEETAQEIMGNEWRELLKNVCRGISYVYLDVAMSGAVFYRRRREFYRKLHLRRI